ncbi:diaminopimelate decarboxylase [Picrophilus oshimae]|uniref:Diaminopimelate decarboxylase n=1 Tax=Picrophilus torridus (strain ATCC 700027 / DSM 9790 / JCM 10055 / NBRC 100828 / KAW 2/3) TaxID=1122961 RepID=A0A8G2FXQ3_PICTO|nr:diaminopimelate decarboxylase [Picrophilus oshimae]SMD31404.1 diaminopimelate decarboxylase [Picrophilus oshimae DSM 9789]
MIENFQYKGNSLFLDDVELKSLAHQFGTPLIVLSEKRINNNYLKIKSAFSKHFRHFKVHYALKANSNPAVISILRRLGAGADAANPNEAEIAMYSGISPDNIIMTGNNLSYNDLKRALEMNIKINFDDVNQMNILKNELPDIISFRINPGYGNGEFTGIKTAGPSSKFGIPMNEALNGYRTALNAGVKKFGIHMMAGSNNLDPGYFYELSGIFAGIIKTINNELGISFDFIDIGGGFGVPYKNEAALDINETARLIAMALDGIMDSNPDAEIIIEPGRYLVADAGIALATVTDLKNYGRSIAGTDLGMNILIRPALYGAVHEIICINKNDDKLFNYDITGQICENTDFTGLNVKLPGLEPGDILGIMNAGAYVSSMSSNYNSLSRAAEVLISDDNVHLIKKRDDIRDIINNTFIPGHLL